MLLFEIIFNNLYVMHVMHVMHVILQFQLLELLTTSRRLSIGFIVMV